MRPVRTITTFAFAAALAVAGCAAQRTAVQPPPSPAPAHVTTPVPRANLPVRHRTAVNLRLVGCTARPGLGDYTCTFIHDFPPERHLSGHAHAHFIAAPADKHGWYMTVLEDCD